MSQALTEKPADAGVSAAVPWTSWSSLGGADLVEITTGANADGRQVVFGLSKTATLYHNWQTAPNGTWGGWYEFGNPDKAPIARLACAANSDGRLALVAADEEGRVWYADQVAVNQGWSPWVHVPGVTQVTAVGIGLQSNGFLMLFASANGVLNVTAQTPGRTWTGWKAIAPPKPGVAVTEIAVAANQDGRLEAAVIFDDNSIASTSQTGTGGWTAWPNLTPVDDTDFLNGVAMAPQEAGWLTMFITGSNGNLYYRYQAVTPFSLHYWPPFMYIWTQFAEIEKPAGVDIRPLALAHSGDGRLQAFGVGSDGALWRVAQAAINVPKWDPWVRMGAEQGKTMAGRPAIGRNADGRLEVFVITSDGTVATCSETEVTSRKAWFEALVASVAPVVYLHPDELYMPNSFEQYIAQTQYVDANGVNKGTPLSPADLTWPTFASGGYLTYPWGDQKIAAGDLDSAVCYVHVRSTADWWLGGGYDIQYWFCYGFNGPGFAGVKVNLPWPIGTKAATVDTAPGGDHEGDWEHILVRVGPDGEIKHVYCSQHDGGTWYKPASSPGAHDGFTLDSNGHPIVYSALYGHPSYVYPGVFPTEGKSLDGDKFGFPFSAGLVNFAKAGKAWNCYETGRHEIVAVDIPGCDSFASPWWLPFQGRCGMLKPSLGNTIQEGADHIAQQLMGDGWGRYLSWILDPFAYTIMAGLALLYPAFDDYKGPTAPRDKSGWWTGL